MARNVNHAGRHRENVTEEREKAGRTFVAKDPMAEERPRERKRKK